MSASSDIQAAIVAILQQPGSLSVNCPVVARITGDLANDIEAAADKKGGLCVYVMPVLQISAESSWQAPFVSIDRAEVRVRIIEQPQVRNYSADAYDLIDEVEKALHGQPRSEDSPLRPILGYPLQLAGKPVEFVEGILEESRQMIRIVDVIFHAIYSFATTP